MKPTAVIQVWVWNTFELFDKLLINQRVQVVTELTGANRTS